MDLSSYQLTMKIGTVMPPQPQKGLKMKLGMLLLTTALVASSAFAQKTQKKAAPTMFDTQVALLTEKADLCVRSGYKQSGHCDDYDEYRRYLFKGSMETWLSYNLDNGNLNDSNLGAYRRATQLMDRAMDLPVILMPGYNK
jgi:hypothetical protein